MPQQHQQHRWRQLLWPLIFCVYDVTHGLLLLPLPVTSRDCNHNEDCRPIRAQQRYGCHSRSTTKDSSLSSSVIAPATGGEGAGNASVCLLWDNNEQNDPQPQQQAVLKNSSEIALLMASNLGLPLVSSSEWLAPARKSKYKFALTLIPYSLGDPGQDEQQQHMTTFALAIIDTPLPHPNDKKTISSKTKKRLLDSASFVEFCPSPNSKAGRRATTSGGPDLLVKAVAPAKGRVGHQKNGTTAATFSAARIYDLTAGFGQDALQLAMSGARYVHMVERNPIVAALLADGLRRLQWMASIEQASMLSPETKQRVELATSLVPKLSLSPTMDSKKWLSSQQKNKRPQSSEENVGVVVYLDPMFPPRRKSASVKKGMAMLHELLESQQSSLDDGDDTDSARRLEEEIELLQLAWDYADLRVVVKRPIKAPTLGSSPNISSQDDHNAITTTKAMPNKPSYSINGSTNRWDVYVKPPPPRDAT